MPDIDNYAIYTDRMRRSMWDKSFFIDKIPGAGLVVDYGCADGSLVRFLHGLFPTLRFIGFDIDAEMIARANRDREEGTAFFTRMEDVTAQIARWGVPAAEIAVNFSSVLHEVFHYRYDTALITALLDAVRPQYITVRDMMFHNTGASEAPDWLVERVRAALPQWQVADFEVCFGPITDLKNLVQLLLKFRYTENWARECPENYFSYGEAELMRLLDPAGAYRAVLHSRYFLPWCRFDAEQALGMELGTDFTTHFSLILARRAAHAGE